MKLIVCMILMICLLNVHGGKGKGKGKASDTDDEGVNPNGKGSKGSKGSDTGDGGDSDPNCCTSNYPDEKTFEQCARLSGKQCDNNAKCRTEPCSDVGYCEWNGSVGSKDIGEARCMRERDADRCDDVRDYGSGGATVCVWQTGYPPDLYLDSLPDGGVDDEELYSDGFGSFLSGYQNDDPIYGICLLIVSSILFVMIYRCKCGLSNKLNAKSENEALLKNYGTV